MAGKKILKKEKKNLLKNKKIQSANIKPGELKQAEVLMKSSKDDEAILILNELDEIKKLIEKGKFQEAIFLLDKFEEKTDLQQPELVTMYFYKAISLRKLGNYPEALKYAEKVYRAIRKQEPTSQLVETLIMIGHASCWLGNFEKGYQYIDEAEQKLNKLTNVSEKQRILFEAMLYISRNCGYMQQGKIESFYNSVKKALRLSERINDKYVLAQLYYQLGSLNTFYKIDIKSAIEYSQKCQTSAEELGNTTLIALNLVTLGTIYVMTGDLKKALWYHEHALKKTDNIMIKMSIFNNLSMIYSQKGELDKALELLEKALELAKQVNSPYILVSTLTSMIEVLVLKDEIELASDYLDTLKEYTKKEKNTIAELCAQFSEGFILKSKNRIQNRAKAQKIFEDIVQKEVISGELTMKALLNLCDLLVEEFHLTTELEVLDELNPLLEKLLVIAENINSFWILAETHLLQAKLAILKSDFKEARKKLTKAQNVAEKYGLSLLASKISVEHDNLLTNLKTWEASIEKEAPLSQRIELAKLSEHIENMLLMRKIDNLKISDEEPFTILIVTEGGTSLLSHSFIKDIPFESHLFSGFLTTIDYFIREMFSERLDRAKFGEYTLLIKSIPPFFVSYIFKGDSYYALQKINYFIDHIQKDEFIWQSLMKSYQINKTIHIKEIPLLESLITDIFIKKNVVIKAF